MQVRIKGGDAGRDGSEGRGGLGEAGASDPGGASLLRAVHSGVLGMAGVMTPQALSCRIEDLLTLDARNPPQRRTSPPSVRRRAGVSRIHGQVGFLCGWREGRSRHRPLAYKEAFAHAVGLWSGC